MRFFKTVPICILLFCAIIFASCGHRYAEKPDPLLSQEQMADIITEILLIENSNFPIQQRYNDAEQYQRNNYYARILAREGISLETFKKNNLYYTENTREYQSIVAEVQRRLKDMLADWEQYSKSVGDIPTFETNEKDYQLDILRGAKQGPLTYRTQRKKEADSQSLRPPHQLFIENVTYIPDLY